MSKDTEIDKIVTDKKIEHRKPKNRKPKKSDETSLSRIINLITKEIELNSNMTELQKYKDNLFLEKFKSLDINSEDVYEDGLLTSDKLNKQKLEYFNELDKELDVYLIYRNFLLLLHFMETFNNNREEMKSFIIKKDDYYTTVVQIENENNEKESLIQPLKLSTLFRKLCTFGSVQEKEEQFNTQYIQETFNRFVDSKFMDKDKTLSKFPIKISFADMLIDNTTYEVKINEKDTTVRKRIDGELVKKIVHVEENTAIQKMTVKNISTFYNSFRSLSQLSYESAIRLFWKVLEGKYNNKNIPQSLNSFLRYYTLNEKSRKPKKSRKSRKIETVNITGVGYDSLVSRFVLDKNAKLNISIKDKNPISQQCRYIQFKIIDDTFNTDNINEIDFYDKSSDTKIDVSISIPPTELPTYLSEEFLSVDKSSIHYERFKNQFPFPSKNLSVFIHYYHSMKLMKSTGLIVVPLSFISVMNLNNSKKDKSIHINFTIEDFERKKSHENLLYNYRIKEIIDEQQIKKIMLLPKGMLGHTTEQCVLLELSSEIQDGIHIINSVEKLSKMVDGQLVLNNNQNLKNVFEYDEIDDVYVNNNGKIIDESYTKDRYLVSRYVSYKDIQNPKSYNYNILPSYHLTDSIYSAQSKKILPDFEIIKSQRKTFKSGTETLYELGQTSFSKYGITTVPDIQKKTKVLMKHYQYFLKDGDILIYETYKSREHMTYFEMKESESVLGTNNLFIIRTENIELSQQLFMHLYSDEGQKKLLSLVKSNGKKDVLTIESLNELRWLKTDKSFDKYKSIIQVLVKKEESLLKYIK